MSALRLGIVGCGNISTRYLTTAPMFRGIEVVACADVSTEAAAQQARAFGVRNDSVDGLLAADDVDLVINLTPPDAHFEVSLAALTADKHVHTEKPLASSVAQGLRLLGEARERGLRLGCAPDTFLGGGGQTARALIDAGRIGRVVGGTCHVMGHGPESWHPSPDFYFAPGGGPMLDMGPYYVTYLVNLVGPVRRVTASASAAFERRTIGDGPRAGQTVPVETPTTVHALLEFDNGALVTLGASFDVWRSDHANIEVYGETGSMVLPDPNFFHGDLRVSDAAEDYVLESSATHPFSAVNRELRSGALAACYRIAGVADIAAAIESARPHRCSGELGLHVLEVLESTLTAAAEGRALDIESRCDRPEPLGPDDAAALLATPPGTVP